MVLERKIPLLDLEAQHRAIRQEVLAAVTAQIDSQKFIMGEPVKDLEKRLADYTECRFALGCASGSDALLLALMAYGVGPGDIVITVPFTFFATVGAIARLGATPVFVDIEPDTFNMDPAHLEEVLSRHPNAKAIIPVHLFGASANLGPILAAAEKHGVPVIEDAAQAIGSEYNGRRVGTWGSIGCFSFFPSKNLGGYGDGGLVTTNDPALAEKLGALRVHGARKKYFHDWVGINSRLDTLQAAVLAVKLNHLDSWTAQRQRNAALYQDLLTARQVPVTIPRPLPYQTRHVWNQFTIRTSRRDELKDALQQQGIGTEIYYPLSMHQQKCFSYLGVPEGSLPVSEQAAREVLSLPVYSELEPSDIEYVVDAVARFHQP